VAAQNPITASMVHVPNMMLFIAWSFLTWPNGPQWE
jgi:hypothetical protein